MKIAYFTKESSILYYCFTKPNCCKLEVIAIESKIVTNYLKLSNMKATNDVYQNSHKTSLHHSQHAWHNIHQQLHYIFFLLFYLLLPSNLGNLQPLLSRARRLSFYGLRLPLPARAPQYSSPIPILRHTRSGKPWGKLEIDFKAPRLIRLLHTNVT